MALKQMVNLISAKNYSEQFSGTDSWCVASEFDK